LGIKRKTIKNIKDDLVNCFAYMKVPGSVIETLDMEWIPALKTMRLIAEDGWGKLSGEQKKSYIDTLHNGHAKQAWEYVSTSKLLLVRYLEQLRIVCTDAEVDSIFAELKPLPYNTPLASFKATIQTFIGKISYERNKQQLLLLWQERSGEKSVSEWCKHHTTPIQWVLDDASLQHVLVVKELNDGKKVDATALRAALDYFEKSSLSTLKNIGEIQKCFFAQIGNGNKVDFQKYREEILSRIRMKLGADVFSWGIKAGDVRDIIETFIRDKNAAQYKAAAKVRVMKMPDAELRNRVIALLDEHPEYCKLFLDSEEQ